MKTTLETIGEFYKRKFDWMPSEAQNDIGHFNVFRLDPQLVLQGKQIAYRKRDYFKITLVIGHSQIQYGDRTIEIQKQALVFCHPLVPYQWDQNKPIPKGYFFVFSPSFFYQFGQVLQYPMFQVNAQYPVFELSDEQLETTVSIFERMLQEIDLEYTYKYDYLRTLVLELVHSIMKSQTLTQPLPETGNASQRIAIRFSELLERQFPIDNPRQIVRLRTASDFADQLNVHANHLNRAVKQVTQKTSTQLIAERLMQEAKTLLKQSTWTISEIAHVLGFSEVTYFNSFFRKHIQVSPGEFRNV